MKFNTIIHSAWVLGAFAVAGTAMVAFVYDNTQARIAENERIVLLRSLRELFSADMYDNDILADTVTITDNELGGGRSLTAYLAWRNRQPSGIVFTTVAPDGYNGPIKLLVGVRYNGTLSGVRVVSHRETPGLGDPIDIKISSWSLGFNGRSIGDPPLERWTVKRHGGEFDQFTGATISPRAVVEEVRRTLLYFENYKDTLFKDKQSTPLAKADE